MNYSIYLALAAATSPSADSDSLPPADHSCLADALAQPLDALQQLVERFRQRPNPSDTARFESDLQDACRELGRVATGWAYNHLEPDLPADLPSTVRFQGTDYRRLARKTTRSVDTLFGTIRLHRLGYRAAASNGLPVLFPLAEQLGIAHGASPAVLACVGRYLAETGATQQQTLRRLRQQHGLRWGVKRLRQAADGLAERVGRHRQASQVEQVVAWLEQAQASRGRHKPVLAAGRDGITLPLRAKGGRVYEVASAATLSVYDRRGQRLGTVYLACVPEAGQATMSRQLTGLIQEVLRRFRGPLPRLCYVTDAGDNETSYYRQQLRYLRHPVSGKRLQWQWVVDYYHAALRLTTLAEALFGPGQRAWSWTQKMQKVLLQTNGVSRVLHSAAALRSRQGLKGKALQEYRKAYEYLQGRRNYMRYAEYRRVGLPIGSGVTEAGCKTVYTQRLKQSGMVWEKAGAQTILTLRVLLLSGVWEQAFERALQELPNVTIPTPALAIPPNSKKSA